MDGQLSICSLEFTILVLFFPYLILPCYIHFSCCTLFTLRSFNLFHSFVFHFVQIALFPCYIFLVLHFFHVTLCSCCTLIKFYLYSFAFNFQHFVHVAFFNVTLFLFPFFKKMKLNQIDTASCKLYHLIRFHCRTY